MGDLVEGIGDEVLLFGAFLAFTACIVILVNFWLGRSSRERQARSPQGVGSQQNDRNSQESNNSTTQQQPSQSSSQAQQGQAATTASDGTQLRSRLRTTAATTGDRSRDNSSQTGFAGDTAPTAAESSQPQEERDGDSLITVRLIMYGSTTKPVRVSPTTTLADMRRVHFSQEISENRPVKFIYQGRVLNDESATLQHLNITDGCPIHVHVGRPRETPQQRAENEQQHANEFLDLSRYFVPLFGVILGIAWVGLFCYPNVFTLITKLFLFFLSVGYILLAYSTSFA